MLARTFGTAKYGINRENVILFVCFNSVTIQRNQWTVHTLRNKVSCGKRQYDEKDKRTTWKLKQGVRCLVLEPLGLKYK